MWRSACTLLVPRRASQIRAVLKDPADSAALDSLRDVSVINAQLHSTCPATVVQAGQSESALPIRAKATIQCRLLPGTKPDEVIATLRRVIDDPTIEIGVIWAPVASAPAVLSADGQSNRTVTAGTKVVVRSNTHVTTFLRRRPPTYFYRVLTAKLRENL